VPRAASIAPKSSPGSPKAAEYPDEHESPEPTKWASVARLDDIESGKALAVEHDGHQLALFRIEGRFFAIEDRCTHRGARLSGGKLEGCEIECPLHGARFDVRDGNAQCPPARTPVRCYAVRVKGEHLQVALPGAAGDSATNTATDTATDTATRAENAAAPADIST